MNQLFQRWAAGLCLVLLPSLAFAQSTPVFQSGTMTKAHDIPKLTRNGQIQDASPNGLLGDANGRGVNPYGILDSLGLGVCSNTADTGSPYNALCLGHDAAGNGLISLDSYGGLADKTSYFRKNGTLYEFPFAVGGIVGPNSSASGNIACWNNGAGTLLKDCGPRIGASPKDPAFGCVGDGVADDTACMQAAINATAYGALYIGTDIYKTGALTLTLPVKFVCTNGHNRGGFRANATNINLLTLNTGNTAEINDCYFDMETAGTSTSGAAIYIASGQNNLKNNTIVGPYIGIDVEGGFQNQIADNFISDIVTNGAGIEVGRTTTGAGQSLPLIHGNIFAKKNASTGNFGARIFDVGGLKWERNISLAMPAIIKPGANQNVTNSFFEGELTDSANGDGFTITTTANTAQVTKLNFVNTWSSTSTTTGLVIANPSGGIVSGLHFVGHRSYNNGAYGVQIGNGADAITDVTFDASAICSNSTTTPNLYDSILINSSAAKGSIRNSTIGNACDGLTTGTAKAGIRFNQAGASNWMLANNDLRTATGTDGSIIGSLPTASKIVNNAGYNPVGGFPVTPGASPWTYTAGPSPETLYVYGGTVSGVFMQGQNVCLSSPCTVTLGPADAVSVTYSAAPTAIKVIH